MITNKEYFETYSNYRLYNIPKNNESNIFEYTSLSDAFFKYYSTENKILLGQMIGIREFINKTIKYINETMSDLITNICISYCKNIQQIEMSVIYKQDISDSDSIRLNLFKKISTIKESYMEIKSRYKNKLGIKYCLIITDRI